MNITHVIVEDDGGFVVYMNVKIFGNGHNRTLNISYTYPDDCSESEINKWSSLAWYPDICCNCNSRVFGRACSCILGKSQIT